jgi:predicted GTPase
MNLITDKSSIKFAIIGRPNVGKSSISNALTQSKRNIVTNIPEPQEIPPIQLLSITVRK